MDRYENYMAVFTNWGVLLKGFRAPLQGLEVDIRQA